MLTGVYAELLVLPLQLDFARLGWQIQFRLTANSRRLRDRGGYIRGRRHFCVRSVCGGHQEGVGPRGRCRSGGWRPGGAACPRKGLPGQATGRG
jgi:hypothetical protein